MLNTILLVDDNEIDNFITYKTLSAKKLSRNYIAEQSANGAIDYLDELLKNHQPFPEIIFLDLNMPVMDGFTFLEFFRTYPRELIDRTCIIILTSSSDPKDMHRAKRFRNVKEYFTKPLMAEKIEKIERCYSDYVEHLSLN